MAIQSVHYQGKGYAITRRMKVGSGGLVAYGSCEIDTSDDSGNSVIQGDASTTADTFVGFGDNAQPLVEGDWVDVLVPVKGVVARATVGGSGAIAAGTVVGLINGGLIDDTTAAGGPDVGIALTSSTAVGAVCTFMLI